MSVSKEKIKLNNILKYSLCFIFIIIVIIIILLAYFTYSLSHILEQPDSNFYYDKNYQSYSILSINNNLYIKIEPDANIILPMYKNNSLTIKELNEYENQKLPVYKDMKKLLKTHPSYEMNQSHCYENDSIVLNNGDVLFFDDKVSLIQLYVYKTRKFRLIYFDLIENYFQYFDNKLFIPYKFIYIDFKNFTISKLSEEDIVKYKKIIYKYKAKKSKLRNFIKSEIKIPTKIKQKYCNNENSKKNILCHSKNLNSKIYGFDSIFLKNKKVLIIGGMNNINQSLNSIELYDLKTKKIKILGHMNISRIKPTSVMINKRKILITGGSIILKDKVNTFKNAEVFDLINKKSIPVKNNYGKNIDEDMGLNYLNWNYKLTPVNSGFVLMTGKINELYDPYLNKFYPIDSNMYYLRMMHNATLLKNGSVLITGGLTYLGISSNCIYFKTSDLITINDLKQKGLIINEGSLQDGSYPPE